MQINTQNLLKEISEEFNITQKETSKVLSVSFEFIRKILAEEPTKSVRLKRFGIFVTKQEYYSKRHNRRKLNKNIQGE